MKKLIYQRPDYELYVDAHRIDANTTGIVLTTRWPQARTDREEHKVLSLSLPSEVVANLGCHLVAAAHGGGKC